MDGPSGEKCGLKTHLSIICSTQQRTCQPTGTIPFGNIALITAKLPRFAGPATLFTDL